MEMIQYRGAYRFSDRRALDHALAIALANLAEWKQLADLAEWKRRFTAIGSSLCIDLDLGVARCDQRQAAAHVMQTLALSAIEGIVVARQRDLAVDVFVCGE